jgi:hypothetical protein
METGVKKMQADAPKKKQRGRPAVADLAKNRTIKLTDADWDAFRAMGGAKWLRDMIKISQQ